MAQNQRPDNWDEIRRNVYNRDGYQCQDCDAMGGNRGDTELHCHHIKPLSKGGSNNLDNLVTLCKNCHNNKHSHDITGSSSDEQDTTSSNSGIIALGVGIILVCISIFAPNIIFSTFGGIGGIVLFPIVILSSVIFVIFGIVGVLSAN